MHSFVASCTPSFQSLLIKLRLWCVYGHTVNVCIVIYLHSKQCVSLVVLMLSVVHRVVGDGRGDTSEFAVVAPTQMFFDDRQ
jgi:hypothetical protein